jgi:hypothetical protein
VRLADLQPLEALEVKRKLRRLFDHHIPLITLADARKLLKLSAYAAAEALDLLEGLGLVISDWDSEFAPHVRFTPLGARVLGKVRELASKESLWAGAVARVRNTAGRVPKR